MHNHNQRRHQGVQSEPGTVGKDGRSLRSPARFEFVTQQLEHSATQSQQPTQKGPAKQRALTKNHGMQFF
jgi:hypothetical protein